MSQPLDLQTVWEARYGRVLRSQVRADVTGMTRPPRNPDERAFLAGTGQLGPFVEMQALPDYSSSRSSTSASQSNETDQAVENR